MKYRSSFLRGLGVKLWLIAALLSVAAAGWTNGIAAALLVLFFVSSAAPYALNANLQACYLGNNALGTLAATGIFHDALGLTLKRLPFLKRMAKDVAPLMAGKRFPFNVAQILKNYNAQQSVYDRGQTGTYMVQQGQVVPPDQLITLNNWPAVSIKLSAVEVNQILETYENIDARALVINKLLTRGFNALGIYIAQAYMAMFTAANFPTNFAIPVGTGTFKTLAAANDQLLLLDALNPNEPGDAILDIAGFREFANSLTGIFNEQIVGEVTRTGVIDGMISGVGGVARYNLPLVTPDSARGFIADPQAVVMVNRVPEEEVTPNDPVYLEIIQDKDTGFVVLYREAKDPNTGEVTRTITTMFTFAKGLSNHAIRLTTS